MIFRKVFIISLLLLCSSCTFEDRQDRPRVISKHNSSWYTVRVNISDGWKIENAVLESNLLHLELDKGNGKEKLSLPLLSPLEDFNQDVEYRGANRLSGLSLLHFTKEDEGQGNKFQLGKSKILKGLKSREVLAVYRVGNHLFVHYNIENTDFGEIVFHDLRQQYLIGHKGQKMKNRPFKITKGNSKIVFGVNYKKNRILTINELIEENEEIVRSAGDSYLGDSKLEWTFLFELSK